VTVDPGWITPKPPVPLIGDEQFKGLPETSVRDFWVWSTSDLRENTIRGVLAEFFVARAVGAQGALRVGWDSHDVTTPSGVRVEVKSSGYLQSWPQRDVSSLRFSGLTGLSWDADTNQLSETREVRADVFVFAVQTCKEPEAYDALDLAQWDFYVASAEAVRAYGARSVGPGFLREHAEGPIDIDQIAQVIATQANGTSPGDLQPAS
jgi:hypothetical protein